MLAIEHGQQVTVAEQADALMRASCTANRGYLIQALARQGAASRLHPPFAIRF